MSLRRKKAVINLIIIRKIIKIIVGAIILVVFVILLIAGIINSDGKNQKMIIYQINKMNLPVKSWETKKNV